MKKEEFLKLIKKLEDEIHINGLSIEKLSDYIGLISDDVIGAHRRIDGLEEEINRIKRY